jgi:hypothetical protein
MGGRGSGRRWHLSSKNTTEDYRALDIRYLQRRGLLAAGRAFSMDWLRNDKKIASIQVRTEINQIILSYRHRRGDADWQSTEYAVRLDWTSCNYGGQRAWFRCPAAGCGRRAAILYGGSIFACRHCHDLVYTCQREQQCDRITRKLDKIRERLDWQPGFLNGSGSRPKGMRQRTYARLFTEQQVLAENALRAIGLQLGITEW